MNFPLRAHRPSMMLLLFFLAAGCAPIPMKYDDCKQQCVARGEDVAKYQVGVRFPIFKPDALFSVGRDHWSLITRR
jgi:hypothetical protein